MNPIVTATHAKSLGGKIHCYVDTSRINEKNVEFVDLTLTPLCVQGDVKRLIRYPNVFTLDLFVGNRLVRRWQKNDNISVGNKIRQYKKGVTPFRYYARNTRTCI